MESGLTGLTGYAVQESAQEVNQRLVNILKYSFRHIDVERRRSVLLSKANRYENIKRKNSNVL